MSILIKGMEMPTCGATMNLIFPNGDVRGMKYGSGQWELLGQAIVLPPHGRLIDADEAIGHLFIGEQCLYSWDEIEESIDATTTIIPAEEGE